MSKKRIVLAALSTAMAAGTLTTKVPDAAAEINAAARDVLMSRVVAAKSTEANVRLASETKGQHSSKQKKTGGGPFDKVAPPFHLFAAGPTFTKGPNPPKS